MRPRSGEGGQAAVELALVLPLVALLLLAAVQVALVVRDQVLLTHAAREAAREAAVEPSAASARRAALAGAPLQPARLTVGMAPPGPDARVSVRLSYRSPTDVPVVGRLLPEVALESRAAMRREQSAAQRAPREYPFQVQAGTEQPADA